MEKKIFGDDNLKEHNIEAQQIISEEKFIILSIVSIGTYGIWWMYKAWRFYQQKEKLDIIPAARAIFSIFFLNSLFNKILDFAKEKGYNESYSSVSLFLGFIVANLLAVLPDPYWLISVFNFIFLIPSFKALNFAKRNSTDFEVIEQESFNGRQIALIVIGLILWGLFLLALTMDK